MRLKFSGDADLPRGLLNKILDFSLEAVSEKLRLL